MQAKWIKLDLKLNKAYEKSNGSIILISGGPIFMWPIGITADDLWFNNISFWYMHYIGIIDIIVSKTGLYSSTCPIGHDQGRIFVHKKLMKGNSLMPYLISYMVIGCTIGNRFSEGR